MRPRPTGRGEAAPDDQPGTVRLVPDLAGRLPGRGAWLHPAIECFDLAVRRRAFGRALRVSGMPDAGEVRTFLERSAQ